MHFQLRGKIFQNAFLDQYLPLEIKEARVDQFINLHQKFNSLAMHASNVVATMNDKVHRYVDILDSYLVSDYTMASLNTNMHIARIHAFAQKLEDQRTRRTQD